MAAEFGGGGVPPVRAWLYGPGMPSTNGTALSCSAGSLARTPGSEKSGGALMPVSTPERFGVGIPGHRRKY